MHWPDTRYLRPALQFWRLRRTQGLLSTLGVVAGVAGLVLVMALGEGASRELEDALGTLGSGVLVVRDHEGGRLRTAQAQRVETLLGDAVDSATVSAAATLPVKADFHDFAGVRVLATDYRYRDIYRLGLHAGRFLVPYDSAERQRVCVLGWDTARQLFPRGQVLGQQVRLGDSWFRVVGWLQPSSLRLPRMEGFDISDIDRVVYLPFGALATTPFPQELIFRFADERQLLAGQKLVRRVLTGAGEDEDSSLEYVIPLELLREKHKVQQIFQYFLLGIAALMLAVGGIGIMNMMMVNVISRRAEIGLRRAVGATRADIVQQFVTESMVIAVAGGLAGIAGGAVLALLIDRFSDWRMIFDAQAAITGFVVSLAIGAVFGGYPAMQAAAVSPIKSLNQP